MITAGELQGMPVRAEDGRRLGRVAEIRVRDGEVVTLVCGPAGVMQRFLSSQRGRRIPWERVVRLGPREVIVQA